MNTTSAIRSGTTTPGTHAQFMGLPEPQAGRELLNEELGREQKCRIDNWQCVFLSHSA